MWQKIKDFFADPEKRKKFGMACLWYACSIGCLFIFEHRWAPDGKWTRQEWLRYFILLNIAWAIWSLLHRWSKRKEEEYIRRLEAESDSEEMRYRQEAYLEAERKRKEAKAAKKAARASKKKNRNKK